MKLLFCVIFVIGAVASSAIEDAAIEERKPLDCPKNEVYWRCSLEVCYTKCDHLKNQPACPQLAPGCFEPACLCKDNYLRNKDGICIPEESCPEYADMPSWRKY